MEIYKILADIMQEQNLSVAETARKTALPDSTVRGIITRKQKTVALEVAFKLANGLGVSLERLNGMPESKKKKSEAKYDFTQKEIQLISAYRRATDDDRAVVEITLRKYITPEKGKTASAS